MLKYIRVSILFLYLTFFNPELTLANYTFNDPFDTNLSNSWLNIPGHISPDLITNFDRTYAKFRQGSSNSYAYLGNKRTENYVISVNFDFYYPNSMTSQGAGFMLTNKVPTISQNPPNDNGDYSVGIWPISGNFYLLSPLCDNTNLCGLPINNRAIFKINAGTWNTIAINYFVDKVRVKLNESTLELPYGTHPLPNGFFFGNPVLATNPQSWMDFFVDNFSIEYGDPTIIIPTFPYLSQNDPLWGSKEYDSASTWAGVEKSGIDRWGCALTSVAMIMQKNGVKTIDGNVDVDPDNLNTWLKSQADGYIGPGLINWLAITRYAKESFSAGHSATKLEYERSYPPATPILPAILGLPGHFVVAHGEDALEWMINDPDDAVKIALPKISTIRSINRFVPSNTDLSYMMFVTNTNVNASIKDELGNELPINWDDEYLTDDVSGGDTTQIRVGRIPKPASGKYKLIATQSAGLQNELKIYLYDDLAQVSPQTFSLIETNNIFDIEYAKEPEKARTIVEIDLTPPPVSTILSPEDGKHVNTNGLVLDWSDVADPSSPVIYNYQSSWPGGSYGPVTTGTNSYIDAPGTPDQTYLWQVQACDSVGNCSAWSTSTLIVDSKAPTADLIFPVPGANSNYFEVLFSELVDPIEATSGANYFLSNWPGAGGSGDLLGDANITYNPESKTARILFTNPGWYISPEQLWGLQNIHDLAGNLLSTNPYSEYSTQMTAPVLSSAPISTPNPTTQISQTWSWLAATDVGSGVRGYSTRTYDALAQQYLNDWLWIGQVLGTSTNLSEGSWQLSLKATDNSGNESDILNSTTLLIDTTLPSAPTNLHFDNPSVSCGGYTKEKLATIDWDDSTDNVNVAGYEYNVDYPLGDKRGSWTTFFTSSSYRGSLNEGIHYIKLRAKDTAGNYSKWSNLCAITYDSVIPQLKEQTTFSNWYTNPQTSYFDFTDPNLPDTYLAPNCEINTEGTEQTCNISPNVCDKAGNCNTALLTSNTTKIDLTKPLVSLMAWGSTINGTAYDSLSGVDKVELEITKPDNSISNVTATGTTSWTYTMNDAPYGTYKIVVTAHDIAGNRSEKISKEFVMSPAAQSTSTQADSGSVQGAATSAKKIVPPKTPSFIPKEKRHEATPTPVAAHEDEIGEVLGETVTIKNKNYWWWIIPLIIALGYGVSIVLKSRGRKG